MSPRDSQRYSKLPTGPMPVTVQSGPTEGDEGDSLTHEGWTPDDAVTAPRRARKEPTLAPWALLAAIVALVTSFFVGWGIPVAIIAVIAAIMALRTPSENRAMAVWALVLGGVATLYSAGWLVWAAYRFGWLG